MSHVAPLRHTLRAWAGPGVLAALLLGLCWGRAAAVPPVDPVEELRQALPFPLGEERNDPALAYRRKTLAKLIANIRTMGDMRRALVLTEWKDTLGSAPEVARIDRAARTELGNRFKDLAAAAAAHGDTTQRLAVATALGEINASVRGLDPGPDPRKPDLTGFGRTLTPILIRLTKDRDQEVRAIAARALGKVNPVPTEAAKALKPLCEKGTSIDRLAAADGLVSLVLVVAQLQKKGRTQTGVEADRDDVIAAAVAVTANVGPALKDSDPAVRRAGMEALLQSATAFRELVRDPYPPNTFPPSGQELVANQIKAIREARALVKLDVDTFAPLIQAAKGQARALARALTDPDPVVREKARRTLELYGNARLRLSRLIESVPPLPAAAAAAVQPAQAVQKEEDELSLAIAPSLEVVTRGVRDPDVVVRRSTLDFLESLEEAAAPAIPAIVGALSDPDRFVRWAAARTLSKIGPKRTDLSVPGLARLLQDPDLDVRLTAEATLKSFGPDARAALPAVIEATREGDAEARIAACQTLTSMGVATAAPAIPALIDALGNRDGRVRKTAAETLGAFGPPSRAAIPVLRGLLRDEEADVRRAASDALLSIDPPKQ